MKKRPIVIVVALLIVAMAGLVLVLSRGEDQKASDVTQSADNSGTDDFTLVNVEYLTDLLLGREFEAVSNELNGQVKIKFGSKVKSGTIPNKPSIAPSGTVTFKVNLDNSQVWNVVLSRPDQKSINLTIPEINYKKNIKIYNY